MDEAGRPERLTILRASPLFSGLSEEVLHGLVAETRLLTFGQGQTIFSQSDQADLFFIVVDGWVKVFRITQHGREVVIGVFTKRQNFAEIAALAGEYYPADAAAVTKTVLLAIPVSWIKSHIADEPQIALTMLASISRQVHGLVDQIETLKGLSATERVVEFLIAQSSVDEGMSAVHLPHEKSLIASRLGMKAESLSRVFHRLRDYGVIVKSDVAIIKDLEALRELVGQDRQSGTIT